MTQINNSNNPPAYLIKDALEKKHPDYDRYEIDDGRRDDTEPGPTIAVYVGPQKKDDKGIIPDAFIYNAEGQPERISFTAVKDAIETFHNDGKLRSNQPDELISVERPYRDTPNLVDIEIFTDTEGDEFKLSRPRESKSGISEGTLKEKKANSTEWKDVNDYDEFEKKVSEFYRIEAEINPNSTLYFTMTGCGPCQAMKTKNDTTDVNGNPIKASIIDQLRQQHEVIEIDIDKYPTLAAMYGISLVPTFINLIPLNSVPY